MILVLCTVNDERNAKFIAKTLIEKNLAGCINILPNISSVYKWENNIVTDNEFLLLIKTQKVLYDELEKAIKSIHPYELPEIISFDITGGSKDYLNWIKNSTKL